MAGVAAAAIGGERQAREEQPENGDKNEAAAYDHERNQRKIQTEDGEGLRRTVASRLILPVAHR
jgi:hypothetical protein